MGLAHERAESGERRALGERGRGPGFQRGLRRSRGRRPLRIRCINSKSSFSSARTLSWSKAMEAIVFGKIAFARISILAMASMVFGLTLLWSSMTRADDQLPAQFEPLKFEPLKYVSPNEEGPWSSELWNRRVGSYFASDAAESYQVFEDWCSSYTQGKTKQLDGRWVIDLYLAGFEDYFTLETSKINSWDDDHQKVRKWRSMYPQSACAPIVEAGFWITYAWYARGGGYANSVTPEGWQLFIERLNKADNILEESKSLASVNPVWYTAKIYTGLGLQKPKGDMISTLMSGLAVFPDYFQSSFVMTLHLLPKWGGSWREIDAFVRAVVDTTEKTQKKMIYARLYWYVSQMGGSSAKFFDETLVDWHLMKNGFDDLIAFYPKSAWNLNNYASFACRANDKETYLALRPRITKRSFYSEAWPSGLSMEICDRHFEFEKSL